MRKVHAREACDQSIDPLRELNDEIVVVVSLLDPAAMRSCPELSPHERRSGLEIFCPHRG
jgi:hypothetical protein